MDMKRDKGMSESGRVLIMLLVGAFSSAQLHASTRHYYYTDPQGNVLAKADAQGNIVATYDYAPYGSSVPSMGSPPNGPGYSSHVNDPDTGLIYMQARYYDPVVGRFLSIDPDVPKAANTFNFNRYEYVNNNPIMGVDPTGRIIQIVGDPTFIQRMNNDISMISQGSGGKVLIEKLQATPNIIYLMQHADGAGNQTQGDPSGISANGGRGTGSNVRIDLTQTTGGKDANGNSIRPEYVGVAHELGHARAIDQGVQSYDKGKGTPGTTPPSEIHSMANENMVRQEHNVPIRPSYYDPPPPPPPPPKDQNH
jgi:RHS repeat-associated protein